MSEEALWKEKVSVFLFVHPCCQRQFMSSVNRLFFQGGLNLGTRCPQQLGRHQLTLSLVQASVNWDLLDLPRSKLLFIFSYPGMDMILRFHLILILWML